MSENAQWPAIDLIANHEGPITIRAIIRISLGRYCKTEVVP